MRDRLTRALLRAVERLNPSKSRGLAVDLHRMADSYDPRPTGAWEAK